MRLTAVFAAVAVILTAWTLGEAEPTLTIQTDRTGYQTGDTIAVTLAVENPSVSTTLDLCVGLLTSDGDIYAMGPSGWAMAIVPWSEEMRMPDRFDMVAHFYFDVPSVLPSPPINEDGEYYFASLCLQPGTWNWASNLALAQFSYAAGGSIPMASIPAGSFLMGSPAEEEGRDSDEGPQRTVYISAFQMSQTEITQKQWDDMMAWDDSQSPGDDHPVEMMTWFDCVSFCNKLSEAEGLTKYYTMSNIQYDGDRITSADVSCNFQANGYRLPTEAEWEYACRAGTTTRFYTGDTEADLSVAGWYAGNSGTTTSAAGQKQPNAWGLYDMHGNVSEWCWDWHSVSYYGTRPDPDYDPTGPGTGSGARVTRGGSFRDAVLDCRSANRTARNRALWWDWVGFRVAKSVQ